MKCSAISNTLQQPMSSIDGSFYGGSNPFSDIEKINHSRILRIKTDKKNNRLSIIREFDNWNAYVSVRLKQLSEALFPNLRSKRHFHILRLLCRNDFCWMLFGRHLQYRITGSRSNGIWELEIFNQTASTHYGQSDLVRIRFALDEQSNPTGFHLCRASDNKIFNTRSLSGDELTRSLFCHFSRLSCGSNLQDDLNHLRFLHDSNLISTPDYIAEKQNLLKNGMQGRLYIIPAKTAHESTEPSLPSKMILTVAGLLLAGAFFWFMPKLTSAAAKASSAQPSLMMEGMKLK